MSPDCRSVIEQLLASRQQPGQPAGRPWAEVAEDLAALPGHCQNMLLDHIVRLLADGFTDEGELLVALFGACRANPADLVEELLVRATESTRTSFKEEYAGLLDDWYEEGAGARALSAVVDIAAGGASRPDAAPALRALLGLRSRVALRSARRLVASEDKEVRDAAANYLYTMEDREAAPDFLRRIAHEADPTSAELLANGLVAWSYVEAASELESLSQDQTRSPEVRTILSLAAAELRKG